MTLIKLIADSYQEKVFFRIAQVIEYQLLRLKKPVEEWERHEARTAMQRLLPYKEIERKSLALATLKWESF